MLEGPILDRECVCLVLGCAQLCIQLLLVIFALVKDVALNFEACFDVLEAAFGLHELELSCATLPKELIHAEFVGRHPLCPLNLLDQGKDSVLTLLHCLLEVTQHFGTLEFGLLVLVDAGTDSRVEGLALCQFFLALLVELPDFFHQVLFLELQFVVFINQLIEVTFKLPGDGTFLAHWSYQASLFKQIHLTVEFGGDDLDLLL